MVVRKVDPCPSPFRPNFLHRVRGHIRWTPCLVFVPNNDSGISSNDFSMFGLCGDMCFLAPSYDLYCAFQLARGCYMTQGLRAAETSKIVDYSLQFWPKVRSFWCPFSFISIFFASCLVSHLEDPCLVLY